MKLINTPQWVKWNLTHTSRGQMKLINTRWGVKWTSKHTSNKGSNGTLHTPQGVKWKS